VCLLHGQLVAECPRLWDAHEAPLQACDDMQLLFLDSIRLGLLSNFRKCPSRNKALVRMLLQFYGRMVLFSWFVVVFNLYRGGAFLQRQKL
jgi:hypothetical protein